MVDSKPYTYSLFGSEVTNDTKVKIIHVATKQFLSSSNVNYTTGSKQQQVCAVVDQGIDGNWWVIRSQSEKVSHGTKIRLTHLVTGGNLHSHKKVKSPTSGQQEVSCYGQNGNGDDNDFWELRMDQDQNKANGLDQNLRVGSYFKLKHVGTGHHLHSHSVPLADRKQEVTAFGDSDSNDLWFIWVTA